jgi:MFS family permease
MVTDGNQINGYRRKPWFSLAWLIFIGISIYMSTVANPSFALITLTMFASTCGYLFADVCADSMVVERARYETEKVRGSLQTTQYTIRSFGNVLGAVLGALLYNTPNWGWGLSVSELFFLSAMIPIIGVILMIWNLQELAASHAPPSFIEQCESIWATLQLRAVWYPMSL